MLRRMDKKNGEKKNEEPRKDNRKRCGLGKGGLSEDIRDCGHQYVKRMVA